MAVPIALNLGVFKLVQAYDYPANMRKSGTRFRTGCADAERSLVAAVLASRGGVADRGRGADLAVPQHPPARERDGTHTEEGDHCAHEWHEAHERRHDEP